MARIAKQDCYALDGVGVRRFIRAGDEIPAGLQVEDGADVVVTGSSGAQAVEPAAPAGPEHEVDTEPVDYSAHTVVELEKIAADRGVAVTGTGQDGRVLKGDLVDALQAADAA